jgi:hypothetical protein
VSILAVMVKEHELRPVPKLALTLDEVIFALGTEQLVKELRSINALVPVKRHGRTMLFDVGDVNRVWADFKAGKFDAALEMLGQGRGKGEG